MTESEILHHALSWLSPRYSPVQIVEVLAGYLDDDQGTIFDRHGIEDAGPDLRRLARRWRRDGKREGGSK
jgi:hypothetical protein